MEAEEIDVVLALERELLTPGVRRSRERLEQLLDAEFTEIGASGRLWTRPDIIAALVEEDVRDPVPISEASCRVVGDGLVLLTYRSAAPGRPARRSSLWRRAGGAWRLLHHQGTLLPVSPAG